MAEPKKKKTLISHGIAAQNLADRQRIVGDTEPLRDDIRRATGQNRQRRAVTNQAGGHGIHRPIATTGQDDGSGVGDGTHGRSGIALGGCLNQMNIVAGAQLVLQ